MTTFLRIIEEIIPLSDFVLITHPETLSPYSPTLQRTIIFPHTRVPRPPTPLLSILGDGLNKLYNTASFEKFNVAYRIRVFFLRVLDAR